MKKYQTKDLAQALVKNHVGQATDEEVKEILDSVMRTKMFRLIEAKKKDVCARLAEHLSTTKRTQLIRDCYATIEAQQELDTVNNFFSVNKQEKENNNAKS
jgi:hypothetical protein